MNWSSCLIHDHCLSAHSASCCRFLLMRALRRPHNPSNMIPIGVNSNSPTIFRPLVAIRGATTQPYNHYNCLHYRTQSYRLDLSKSIHLEVLF